MNNNVLVMNNQNITSMIQDDNIECKLKEAIDFVENKIINDDGLTLEEVLQALIQMLNGDPKLVKKVLNYANIMAKHGMKLTKESQLKRVDVLRILAGEKNIVQRQDLTKKLPHLLTKNSIKETSRSF